MNQNVKIIIKLQLELHLNLIFIGKKHFHKNPLYFRIYTYFEVDSEIHNSSIGNERTNIFEQNPMINGYRLKSELNNVLQSRFYEYSLGHDNVDWFVIEVIKL